MIMHINSAVGSALYGIRKGLTGLDENAAKIASADTFNSPSTSDLARPLVKIQNNRLQVETSVKTLKTVDETIGSLIDVIA
jgi:hypothetical protein